MPAAAAALARVGAGAAARGAAGGAARGGAASRIGQAADIVGNVGNSVSMAQQAVTGVMGGIERLTSKNPAEGNAEYKMDAG